MFELPGYQTEETMGKYEDVSLYRLTRVRDGLRLLAKTTSHEYPGTAAIDSFRQEFELLTRLNGSGTVQPFQFEIFKGRPVLLIRDNGAITLDRFLRDRREVTLLLLLEMAVGLADCLFRVHRERIIHYGLIPGHILIHPDTGLAELLELRNCSVMRADSSANPPTSHADSRLAYLSPEQTGRTGIEADYRSDYYAFGVILYEWFTGSLPFIGDTAADMIYAHIALTPEPASSRNLDLPVGISDIIGKCLEKMPEARYASALGIKSDLERCLCLWREHGEIKSFPLASQDIPEQWKFGERLYGRDEEQQMLHEALRLASDGTTAMVRIGGNGGIGKTFLVQQTLKQILPEGSFFADSKFNSGQVASPYEMWVEAIGKLTDQLLTENELQSEIWKLRILDALEGYGKLLVERVPRLELLIGPQQEVPPLAPAEAQQRFHLLLNRFISLFSQRGRPLVLFFDDLQWADEASLHYLAQLLSDQRNSKYLLVIGALRDTEISPQHPAARFEAQLQGLPLTIKRIELEALEMPDLLLMLQDTMHAQPGTVQQLADILMQKMAGSPFFIKQFLQDLFSGGFLTFHPGSRSWQWDMQRIYEMHISDDMATYLSVKLKHLPEAMVLALSRAAYLGSSFHEAALIPITGLSKDSLHEALELAVNESLLRKVVEAGNNRYRFQHDRIQQAAFELVIPDQRPMLHWQIGWFIADQGGEIYEAVNHLNQAWEHVGNENPGQRKQIAELNLRAGIKAKQANAYETARGYFRMATRLLDDNCWEDDYGLAFQSYKERSESEYLCGQYETAQQLFEMLLERSGTPLDKVFVYTMMLQLESNKDNYEGVLRLGEKALDQLGIPYQFQPSKLKLAMQLMRVRRKLQGRSPESLLRLPPMEDEALQAAMTVLVHVGNACFMFARNGWVSTSLTMIEMTLDYGIAPESSIACVGYAMLLCFQFQKHKAAYDWGMLALAISKPYPVLYTKTLSSFSLCFDSWRKYDPQFMDNFSAYAGKIGLESGDLWLSNQSVIVNCGLMLQYGYPLRDIYDKLVALFPDLEKHRGSLLWMQASVLARMSSALTDYSVPHDPFRGEDAFTEHGHQEQLIQITASIYHYITAYFFENYEEAERHLDVAEAIQRELKEENFNASMFMMFQSLTWSMLYDSVSKQRQRSYLSRMRKNLAQLKKYTFSCPENYRHKYLIVKAEIARIVQKDSLAEELYEEALDDARLHGHVHNGAIIAECYAKYGLNRGKHRLAQFYMAEAYEAYGQWGAEAKRSHMEEKYGYLLNLNLNSGMEQVDYLSVVMAAQALSSEMEMPSLLKTLLGIMLRNAGAEFGALIFENDSSWAVEACGTEEELIVQTIPLEDAVDILPLSVVGYTARTQEEVVLHNATEEGMFIRNHYVREKKLRSVLCLPIIHQNKLICLLYMENNLSPGVFTSERLSLLKLLCAQCAISIENARLYSGIQMLKLNLEEQVEERTRSLRQSMSETSAALAEMSVYAERNRIAQEIHDVVGHGLTSTILQIEAGKRLLHKEDKEGAVLRLQGAQDLIRHSLNEIRGSVHMLREGQDFNLVQAMDKLIRDTGVAVETEIVEVPAISLAHKKVFYHALQEGLTNGIRHGGSKAFRFTLQHDHAKLYFLLKDNGIGADHVVMGFGLQTMKERVEQLGGRLQIQSKPSEGCILTIELPYSSYKTGDKG
ncbi:AAA family ATPase [Paenibacillus radicis (ex Gao et al. 2016)]|uniref:Serine/threonine protein kinase n=1 Tax=Paenibacillus radicis (ex Gao et al. 2016) TaxID=1737354 RepID=A0A917M049_9BACL|nr:AAA family ATPase [Paenibacillus radicis (ex Gao et al. 2016)]GGG67249.1 serine/threonine protein kinase [Paenibacillus radicis (ex Gao et al. 2016)]